MRTQVFIKTYFSCWEITTSTIKITTSTPSISYISSSTDSITRWWKETNTRRSSLCALSTRKTFILNFHDRRCSPSRGSTWCKLYILKSMSVRSLVSSRIAHSWSPIAAATCISGAISRCSQGSSSSYELLCIIRRLTYVNRACAAFLLAFVLLPLI